MMMGTPNAQEGGFTLVQSKTIWDITHMKTTGYRWRGTNRGGEKSEEDQFVSCESDRGEVFEKPE